MVTQLLRFGTSVMLARLLSPRDFGVVAVALVITAFLDQVKDVGTASAIVQRRTVNDGLLSAVFVLNCLLGLLACAFLVLMAGPLASLLGSPGSAPIIRVFGLATLVTSFGNVHMSLLKRAMRFNTIAVLSVTAAVVSTVVSIAVALAGMTYWALVLGPTAAAVVSTALLWRVDAWRPRSRVNLSELRSIWSFGSNVFLTNILYLAWSQIDKVIISRAAGGTALGTYTMAQRFVTTPTSALSSVIGEVTFPAFSRRQDDDEALWNGFRRASAVIALVTFPVLLGAAAVAAPLVRVVLGPQWEPLIPVLWILAPVGALQSITLTCPQLLLAKGRSDWSLRWGIVYLVVLGGCELLFARWGSVGVAAGFGLGIALLTPFTLKIVLSTIGAKVGDFAKQMAPYAVMALVMAAAAFVTTRCVGPTAVVQLACGVTVGVAVYGGLALLLRPPALQDATRALRGGIR